MFARIFFCAILMGIFTAIPQPMLAESHKEAIDSGTSAYRLVRYTRPDNAFTCIAMVCDRRDAQRCDVDDGLFSISKRTEDPNVYISYYPAEREASRKLRTRIRIDTFKSRSFLPIQDYPDTWVVPDIPKNEDMMNELRRAARRGPVEVTVKTETFTQKYIRLRDLDGMTRDVSRLCPYEG